MSVGVEDDLDVVRVVEGGCGALKRWFVELPAWGVPGPDHFRDIAPVRGEAGSAAFGQEVVEVPEAGFEVGADRVHGVADVLDEVAIDADEAGAPFRPQRGGHAGCTTAPVE